jgi:hypothetical protein
LPLLEQIASIENTAIACSFSLEKIHMRKVLKPILAMSVILFAIPAYAEDYTGTVEAFDSETNVLILDEEMEFVVPDDLLLPELEPGELITIEYEQVEDLKVVERVILSE